MKTLKISEEKALELYKTADSTFKQLLEENFGKDFFNQKITDKVYNLLTLCQYLKVSHLKVFINPQTPFEKYINACAIIPKIVEVYNEGTILNWNNTSEYKYLSYIKKVGSGWVGDVTGGWGSSASGPFAHHYKSRELAIVGFENFKEIYLDYFTFEG